MSTMPWDTDFSTMEREMIVLCESEHSAEQHMDADCILIAALKRAAEEMRGVGFSISANSIDRILEAYREIPKTYHKHSLDIDPDNVVSGNGD